MKNGKHSIKLLLWELLSLSVYRGVLEKPSVSFLVDILRDFDSGDRQSMFKNLGLLCSHLSKSGRLHSLTCAIGDEVLSDQNPFTLKLAADGVAGLSDDLIGLARRDLYILYRASGCALAMIYEQIDTQASACLPPFKDCPSPPPLDKPWDQCIDSLSDFHLKNGVGMFIKHPAFLWQNGDMNPVCHPDPIRLYDLKSYETQKHIAVQNTLAFLNGYGANNMLLYGDRGTGKSSTVKALLNEYRSNGLRMVEMPKESLNQLPKLTARLAKVPMKFIVFIDDLSFSSSDDNFAALKAVLEGGLSVRPENVLIYATSNRRHLLRETFSDRGNDEIHRTDTVQESVSLSDRFGIFLTFLMPDKQHFLEIIQQLADDYGLEVEHKILIEAAERRALERGARSPRFARQFIIDAQARLWRGQPL